MDLSLSLSHTHTHSKDIDDMYIIFTRFHRVMCTEVHVSCILYATESSSSSCSNSLIVVWGLQNWENESNLQVRTGFPRKRCWGGSGSFACPLKNCNPTAFNLCFPQSTSKCTFDHISQQQSKSLCKFPCKILLKNKRKTALYKIKSHWHHFMNSFKHLIVGLWSLQWLSEGDLQKYGYFVPYWCAKWKIFICTRHTAVTQLLKSFLQDLVIQSVWFIYAHTFTNK